MLKFWEENVNTRWQKMTSYAALTLMLALLFGCGESEETNAPAVKLTASTVTSATASGHTHAASIPFADLGTSTDKTYQSSSAAGHTHYIALSPQQFTDLNDGKRVIVTSTTDNGHTHSWEIQGGAVLYESMCYNCHSNDQRGAPGMGSTPSQASQRNALQNPAGAPLSTASPATPNPTPNPTPTPTTGQAVYDTNCAGCHLLGTYDAAGSAPNLSGKGSLVTSKFPTAGAAGHKGITLTATQISDVQAFLNAN